MKPIFPFIVNRKYTDDSILGLGAIKGKNCIIKDITDNVVTFEWTADDGTKREATMTVDATTPIEDIVDAVDEWLEEHKDELHGEDGKTVFVGAVDDAPEEAVLIFDPNEVVSQNNYTKVQADVRFAKSVDVGDKTKLVVSTWKDLVEAINTVWLAGMGAYKFEVDETKKQLTIVTRGGVEIPIDIAQIILNTNITEFKDMLVTNILDGQSLVYSASKKKWVNKSIDSSGMLVEAKKYTDDEIKKFNNKGSLAVDEKPTYYGGIITYKQGGETKTTDNAGTWFYYFDENAKAVQTIFIEGTEFTIAMAGDINLDDYVAKLDLTDVYDENFVDKTKVPTTAYMEEFKGAIDEDLGGKVNVADVIDALNSDATDKPLSAKQGKVLADSKLNNTTDVENSGKALVVDASGNIVFGDAGVNVSSKDGNKIETKNDGIFVASEIDDESESEDSTWSSTKINANLTELNASLVDLDGKRGTIPMDATSITGDILQFALENAETWAEKIYATGAGVTNVPTFSTISDWSYSKCIITKRTSQIWVELLGWSTGTRAINVYDNNKWSGWQELATMDKVAKRKTITVQTDSNGNIGLDVPVEKFVNAFIINQGELVRFLNVYTWANVAYGRVTDLSGNVITGTHTVTILYNE